MDDFGIMEVKSIQPKSVFTCLHLSSSFIHPPLIFEFLCLSINEIRSFCFNLLPLRFSQVLQRQWSFCIWCDLPCVPVPYLYSSCLFPPTSPRRLLVFLGFDTSPEVVLHCNFPSPLALGMSIPTLFPFHSIYLEQKIQVQICDFTQLQWVLD